MTFKEANGILAHKAKHSGIEILEAKDAFNIEEVESICDKCDRCSGCAMQDMLGVQGASSCNFFTEDDTPEEDYETYE